MLVNLHAAALLLIVVTTVAILIRGRKRSPTSRQAAIAAIIAGGLAVLVLAINAHACLEGTPNFQCIICGACLWCVLAYLEDRRLRSLTAISIVIAMTTLAFHYTDLVHTPNWTGNPRSPRRTAVQVVAEQQVEAVSQSLRAVEPDNQTQYPEGWVRDMPFAKALQHALLDVQPFRRETGWAWHSAFTGLFRTKRIDQDFWYPGGTIADAASKLALKDRLR